MFLEKGLLQYNAGRNKAKHNKLHRELKFLNEINKWNKNYYNDYCHTEMTTCISNVPNVGNFRIQQKLAGSYKSAQLVKQT